MSLNKIICRLMILLTLMSCSFQKEKFIPYNWNDIQKKNCLKIDNFYVILDSSGSMGLKYFTEEKITKALDFLSKLNDTLGNIPDFQTKVIFTTFGKRLWDKRTYVWSDGPQEYNHNNFGNILNMDYFPNGKTIMSKALQKATTDIKSIDGFTAVIIISDGNENNIFSIKIAQQLKEQLGKRVQINSILVGDSSHGRRVLLELSRIGEGIFKNIDELSSPIHVAEYVNSVFFTNNCKDKLDQSTKRNIIEYDQNSYSLNQQKSISVEQSQSQTQSQTQTQTIKYGEALIHERQEISKDSDGDGIKDEADHCPNSPRGASIDHQGCWKISKIYYKSEKESIPKDYYAYLDEIADVMKKNPELRLKISGYSDSIGSSVYNQLLSENRAKEVMRYILNQGISRTRLLYKGYGELDPLLPNDTEEGRMKNRRVEFEFSSISLVE